MVTYTYNKLLTYIIINGIIHKLIIVNINTMFLTIGTKHKSLQEKVVTKPKIKDKTGKKKSTKKNTNKKKEPIHNREVEVTPFSLEGSEEEIPNIVSEFKESENKDKETPKLPSEDTYTLEVFKSSLEKIKNDDIREFTVDMLTRVPEYFYTAPASKSGRYHPKYAQGRGGLVRHTISAVNVLGSMIRNKTIIFALFNKQYLSDTEVDICISAIILHDTVKQGPTNGGGGYLYEHAQAAVKYINKNLNKNRYKNILKEIDKILGCIYFHMGQWNKYGDNFTNVLKSQITPIHSLVHLCDYVSSLIRYEGE